METVELENSGAAGKCSAELLGESITFQSGNNVELPSVAWMSPDVYI